MTWLLLTSNQIVLLWECANNLTCCFWGFCLHPHKFLPPPNTFCFHLSEHVWKHTRLSAFSRCPGLPLTSWPPLKGTNPALCPAVGSSSTRKLIRRLTPASSPPWWPKSKALGTITIRWWMWPTTSSPLRLVALAGIIYSVFNYELLGRSPLTLNLSLSWETWALSLFQGAVVFCIITKLLITDNQFQGNCREVRMLQRNGNKKTCAVLLISNQ